MNAKEKFAYPFDDLAEIIRDVQFGRVSIPIFAEIETSEEGEDEGE